MNLVFMMSRAGFACVVLYIAALCPQTAVSLQQATESDRLKVGVRTDSTSDFEVKSIAGRGFLVRRKGTLKWTPSSELSEPIAVGSLDDGNKIYVASKVIKPPKARHMEDPDYPESERKSGKDGRVSLLIVVDEQGNVLIPTADASPGPEFTKSAIEAVKKWRFDPAKFNGQPVAVLVGISIEFRHY